MFLQVIFIALLFFLGTSDPYVKFKLNGRLLHKSKTVHKDLNPVWDETFIVPIEDPFQCIQIKVRLRMITLSILNNILISWCYRCSTMTGDYRMILWVQQYSISPH